MLRSEAEKLNNQIDEIATHAFTALRMLADYRESGDPGARGAYSEIHKLIADFGTLRMQIEILGRVQESDAGASDGEHAAVEAGDPPSQPIKLALTDAYGIVLAGVAAILEPLSSRVRVVELDGRRRLRPGNADIVLYDTFGPMRERDLDRDIARLVSAGTAKVVVFSWNLHPDRVARALRRGASGYLAKSLSAEEIVSALERVRAGETVVAPDPAAALSGNSDWPGQDHGLTHREAQIVTLIARGLHNHEIATRLSLSPSAVKIGITSVYRKIGISRRTKLISWAISQGFLLTDLSHVEETPPRPSTSLDVGAC